MQKQNLNLHHCSSTDSETFIQMQLTRSGFCEKKREYPIMLNWQTSYGTFLTRQLLNKIRLDSSI